MQFMSDIFIFSTILSTIDEEHRGTWYILIDYNKFVDFDFLIIIFISLNVCLIEYAWGLLILPPKSSKEDHFIFYSCKCSRSIEWSKKSINLL